MYVACGAFYAVNQNVLKNKIAHHIEQQSAKIDRAIALQELKIEQLKELKATLIDSAVTGKIKVSEV
ncbi:MAG: hypothetical protein GXZ19_05675 [Bacteroidales bacterium]|nr:hypothetical protein [Bacteroidales bacterium]